MIEAIGLARRPASGGGQSCGVISICWRRSGAALSSVHCWPSPLTATHDCVRLRTAGLPLRASAQLRQLQLTCGKPPPAEEPRTLMSMQPPPEPIAYARRTNTNGGRSRRLSYKRRPKPPSQRNRGDRPGSGLIKLARQIAGDFRADVLLCHFGLVPFLHAILHMVQAHKTLTGSPGDEFHSPSYSPAERCARLQGHWA